MQKSVEKPREFFVMLRRKLRQTNIAELARLSGMKRNTLNCFALGKSKGITEETYASLRSIGFITDEDENVTKKEVCPPLQVKPNLYKTIKEVQEEKGYSAATVRKYAREGMLAYYMEGRSMLIAVDDGYRQLPLTEKKALENEVKRLTLENEELRAYKEMAEKEERREEETREMEAAFSEYVADYEPVIAEEEVLGLLEGERCTSTKCRRKSRIGYCLS